MIAVDTNILVAAHREDSGWHEPAYAAVAALAEAAAPWAIPWPCVHEFLAIATHQRIFSPPSPLPAALAQVDAWMESPSLVLLTESSEHWRSLRASLDRALATGPLVHDARIAALCRQHGVTELWTADRDFSRFPELTVRNPLLDHG